MKNLFLLIIIIISFSSCNFLNRYSINDTFVLTEAMENWSSQENFSPTESFYIATSEIPLYLKIQKEMEICYSVEPFAVLKAYAEITYDDVLYLLVGIDDSFYFLDFENLIPLDLSNDRSINSTLQYLNDKEEYTYNTMDRADYYAHQYTPIFSLPDEGEIEIQAYIQPRKVYSFREYITLGSYTKYLIYYDENQRIGMINPDQVIEINPDPTTSIFIDYQDNESFETIDKLTTDNHTSLNTHELYNVYGRDYVQGSGNILLIKHNDQYRLVSEENVHHSIINLETEIIALNEIEVQLYETLDFDNSNSITIPPYSFLTLSKRLTDYIPNSMGQFYNVYYATSTNGESGWLFAEDITTHIIEINNSYIGNQSMLEEYDPSYPPIMIFNSTIVLIEDNVTSEIAGVLPTNQDFVRNIHLRKDVLLDDQIIDIEFSYSTFENFCIGHIILNKNYNTIFIYYELMRIRDSFNLELISSQNEDGILLLAYEFSGSISSDRVSTVLNPLGLGFVPCSGNIYLHYSIENAQYHLEDSNITEDHGYQLSLSDIDSLTIASPWAEPNTVETDPYLNHRFYY